MFVCVPDKFKNNVSDVSPGHWRIQAVLLNVKNRRILITNLYLPVDKNVNVIYDGSKEVLDETLSIVDKLIEDVESGGIVIASDLN